MLNETYSNGEYQRNAELNPIGDQEMMNDAHALVWDELSATINKPEASRPITIVDIGAGTGRYAEAIHNRLNPDALVIGVDNSPEMLEASQYRHDDYYQPVLMDATKLGLPDQSADLVISIFALHHLEQTELQQAFNEINRVLKDGAHVIIAANTVDAAAVKNLGLEESLIGTTPLEILDHRPGNKVLAHVANHLYDKDIYLSAAEVAGLKLVSVDNAPNPNTIAQPQDHSLIERGLKVYETVFKFQKQHKSSHHNFLISYCVKFMAKLYIPIPQTP